MTIALRFTYGRYTVNGETKFQWIDYRVGLHTIKYLPCQSDQQSMTIIGISTALQGLRPVAADRFRHTLQQHLLEYKNQYPKGAPSAKTLWKSNCKKVNFHLERAKAKRCVNEITADTKLFSSHLNNICCISVCFAWLARNKLPVY